MKGLSGKALLDYKQHLVLKPDQHDLIIGLILGDGSMRLPGRSHHANITIEHGEEQKEYVWWKYGRSKEWVLTPPNRISPALSQSRTRTLASRRFSTITHPALTSYYELFYRNGIKTIPENMSDLLAHPLTLAVWLMDDGNRNKDVLFLSTQNFTLKEQERLQHCLWGRVGIDSTLNFHSHSKGEKLYWIRLTREGSQRAAQLVLPYIIPSLTYKFSAIPL
ncbi:MAG: LAGLIDADG endonuclease [candidate division WOR-3 bacterium]